MIPKIIHYCWFGKTNKNDTIKKCIESWGKILPDYHIQEWNETNFPMDLPYVKKAYSKKLWAHISDLARLCVLFERGGIYFDTDIEVLMNIDPLLKNNIFLGFQQKEYYPYQFYINNKILNLCYRFPNLSILLKYFHKIAGDKNIFYISTDWVNNSVIGSIPKHPFLKKCIDKILQRFDESNTFYRSPEVTTIVLREMGLKKYGNQTIQDIKLYTSDYFSPYPYWGVFRPECIKENTYCVHHWQVSWLSK